MNCNEISFIENPQGQVVLREIELEKTHSIYRINVGTESYIDDLLRRNSVLPSDEQIDDKILPIPGSYVPKAEILCPQLHQLPDDVFARFAEVVPIGKLNESS